MSSELPYPIVYYPDALAPYTGPPDTDFYRLDRRLQGLETRIVYVGAPLPDTGERLWWDLLGTREGMQGLTMAPGLKHFMYIPFQQLMSSGPYQVGATFERVDYQHREISFGVQVGHHYGPDTSFRYRMLEQRWWQSWSPTEDGWFGCYTRTHGWRWLRVRLAEASQTAIELDPVAFNNNFMEWDMTAIAADPYWHKRIETNTWRNSEDTTTPFDDIIHMLLDEIIPGYHVGEGQIVVPNRGTEHEWPKFLVSGGAGRVWIADGEGGPMIEMPIMTDSDGTVFIDTDPDARTLTAEQDPVDNVFFQILRNSQLLDFLLHDITSTTLPIWRRFEGKGFSQPIPPRSVARLKVYHSNANGVVTALVPQRFKAAYAT